MDLLRSPLKTAVGVSLVLHGLLLGSLAVQQGTPPSAEGHFLPVTVSLAAAVPLEKNRPEPGSVPAVEKSPPPEESSPSEMFTPDSGKIPDPPPVEAENDFSSLPASGIAMEESAADGEVSDSPLPEELLPALVSELTVEYPYKARKKGYEGNVLCRVRIGTDGTVLDATVSASSGYDILDRAALEAVREGEYRPGSREEFLEVNVIFQLS